MIAFVDTSALAKRYLPEIGSTWVSSWIAASFGNTVVVSELTSVEMFSLLKRRHREGSLNLAYLDELQANVLQHMELQYMTVPIDDEVLSIARNLVTSHPLRALDAVQLASAIKTRSLLKAPVSFISADNNLLTAAAAEGFAVDNPLSHP